MRERQQRRLKRTLRGASSVLVLALLAASGCSDEVGGDGFVADPPKPGQGGMPAVAGTPSGGGDLSEAGAAGEAPSTGGKGGSSHAGSAGKSSGGRGGGMADGGMGGDSGAVCGNKQVEAGEECDDGNTKSGDGCTADCKSGCEVCEKTYCAAVRTTTAGDHGWVTEDKRAPGDLYTSCFEMAGVAEGGPAQGVSRAELCQEVVDCVRREQCAQWVPDDDKVVANVMGDGRPYRYMRCYCDRDVTELGYLNHCKDPTQFVAGKCLRQFQEASERDDVAGVFNGIPTSVASPSNMATVLLQACDRKLCAEECFPESTVGLVASISADILWTRNSAGESPLGDLVVDAERAATGTDFALLDFNETGFLLESHFGSAGLRLSATPGRSADAPGRVLESELWHVLFGMDQSPAANFGAMGRRFVTMQLTGQQLYDLVGSLRGSLHVSGLAFEWDGASSLVTQVLKGGVAIDKTASYSVTVNDVMAPSIVGAANVVMTDKNPEQELVRYLKAQPQPIAPPTLNRVTRQN
jgi:cysteine-rich repeat protein